VLGEVEVGGLRIAYQRVGEGPPVLFLHGFFGDHRVWRQQLELAREYTLVAWDAPGCVRSAIPPESFRMPEYAAVLAEFIARVGVDRPHLVGNSFGGTLALQLAIEHPGTARSIVGIGRYAGWSGSFPPEVVAQRLSQTVPDLDLPPDQVASKWVPGFVTPSAPELLKRELHDLIAGFHPAGMRPMIRALAEADLSDSISDVNVPTLLIWGDQDVRSPVVTRLTGATFRGR
jgi:pimeloyl-ACP methyl ester carboxylesterase